MRVALISTYVYPVALGLRFVSAFLKRDGHDVSMIFLSAKGDHPDKDLAPGVRDDLVDHCRSADVVGLSLMTNSFYRSAEITRLLRDAGIKAPVVWGGTHPTVAPEESARVADYVCVGEGEKSMCAFVDALDAGEDPARTRGFAYIREGRFVQNPAWPLTDDLSNYPFPDYDLDQHWIMNDSNLVPVRPELLRGAVRRYRTSSTRGCPYSCSFCNNSTQMQIYRGPGLGKWVRKRSNESLIAEIESVREKYPQMEAVNLIDDLFLVRSEEEIEAFVDAYRSRVNLPIEIDAFPNTVTDPKIALLSRLPIELISMGIQSGSSTTLRNLYNRPTRIETIARAIDTIARHGLRAEYHYLVSNPFESDENRIETLRFAADHHRGPAKIRIFPLQFYPGSRMYDQAREAGIIGDHHEDAYRHVYAGRKYIADVNYLEIWLMIVLALRGAGFSPRVANRAVDFAVHPFVRKCLDHRWFAPACFIAYRTGRLFYRNLLHKPFIRPVRSLRNRRAKRRATPEPRRRKAAA